MADDPTDDTTQDDASAPEGEFVDRRSGKDRRKGGERRRGGRRYRRQKVGEDRRTGADRRGPDRRSGTDRRIYHDPRYKKARPRTKDASAVYSAEEEARVRHILSHVGHRPVCPVCEGSFTLGPVDHRGLESVRQVTCAECGRGTVVTNCLLARVMVLTRVDAVSRLLRAILTAVGHEVVQPPHTGLALSLYRENPPDAVIMDTFALTEMDGQEFIRQLRVESSDPRIIVLAPRPSYRMADPSATARHLGATYILRTPFTREDLFKALKEARR
jgi:CheY-like chemotaxis protein